ncbi:hypothetical protein Rhe02_20440 [Rhizocola hellebori]|uniref:NodB homology domain-containing protein n=1 Tax=Rhizocola hellebori TaxID=1392758 RepID=A0A8J3Q5V5_9ACTN|nr:polysaccharide deacetylase family protein [Rhizocola hellebori]GIH03977.1 hypothetical protein Rhe02_20440 [Rhizocola hellebori]
MFGNLRPQWSSRTARLAVLAVTVAMGGVAMALTATPSSAATCNGYVGLTYDDGPTGSTSALLNVLRANGVRATMFNVGQNVQNNRSAAQAQVAAGMWVGNHSWNHSHMTSFSQSQMQSDLSQTNQAIPVGHRLGAATVPAALRGDQLHPAVGRVVAGHAADHLGCGLPGLERRQRQRDRVGRRPAPERADHPDARRDPEHP